MKFEKSKSISIDSKGKIYLDKIETDESIMIDEEYIFLDSIKTTKEIVITNKTIILGDIECNFLNVIGKLICYGNMKINTIFTTADIDCYQEVICDNVMSGKINKLGTSCQKEIIKEVEKIIEVVKEVNPFENLTIDEENIDYPLSLIDELKDQIIKYVDEELIFLEEDEFIKELEKIGFTFFEFKNDSEFLKKMKKYSELDRIRSFSQYLDFLNLIKDIPNYLEGIDLVENTIDKLMIHSFEELKELEVDLKDKEDVLKLLADIFCCKNELNENYNDLTDWFINKYKNLLVTANDTEEDSYINEEEIQESNIDINDLYEQYVWKKGSLLECTVKSIKDDYIELCDIGNENNKKISIIMNDKDTSKYTVGQTILGCILRVNMNEEKLNIEIVNDSDNIPRLIYKYLSPKHGLTNTIIQNFSRVKGKSTCIVIALSSLLKNNNIKIACRAIESEMKKYLNGEEVNIFIYDKDPVKFAANILDINESNININKLLEKCIITGIYIPDENRINILLKIQKENLERVFRYKFEIETRKL